MPVSTLFDIRLPSRATREAVQTSYAQQKSDVVRWKLVCEHKNTHSSAVNYEQKDRQSRYPAGLGVFKIQTETETEHPKANRSSKFYIGSY